MLLFGSTFAQAKALENSFQSAACLGKCAKSWTDFHTKKQLNWIELNYLLQDISVSSSSFLADGSYYFNFVELDAWHGNDNTRQRLLSHQKSINLKDESSNPYELSFVIMLGIIWLNFVSLFSVDSFIHPPQSLGTKNRRYQRPKNLHGRKELLQLLRGFARLGSDEAIMVPELPTKMWSKLVTWTTLTKRKGRKWPGM